MPTDKTYYDFLLGNIRIRSRISRAINNAINNVGTPVPVICHPCSDNSQIILHNAKAIVLNCMDFRLRDNVTCHLNQKGYKNEYDEVIVAGASLGYNGLQSYTGWDTFTDQHVELSYNSFIFLICSGTPNIV